MHHLNLGHGLAVQALRATSTGDPGYSVTLNMHVFRGEGEGAEEAVRTVDGLANRVFLQPMLEGGYPEDVLAVTAGVSDWSFVRDGDAEAVRQPLDVLGVNYYATTRVRRWDGVSPRLMADGHKDMGGTPWPGADDVEFLPQPGPAHRDGLEHRARRAGGGARRPRRPLPGPAAHGHRERRGVRRRGGR